MRLLVLRPQPGAAATVARARAMGLMATAHPLFEVGPLDWLPPDPLDVDALLVTSAAALRHGGAGLSTLAALTLYAVGEATAAAARAAGFDRVVAGDSDVTGILALAEAAGVRRILHLAGRDHRAVASPLTVLRRLVYAAEPTGMIDAALLDGALPLLHSPRAAARFAGLVDAAGVPRASLAIAALSPAVAAAAGAGWAAVAVAPVPTDAALLAVAAGLCKQAQLGRPRG